MDREAVGIIIGVVALGVSIWSVLRSQKTARRQNRLQERLLKVEQSRERDRVTESQSAKLRAWVDRAGRTERQIVINEGQSEARAVKTLLDGLPIVGHPLVPQGVEEVTHLGPGAHAEYLLAVSMGAPATVQIEVEWEDDTGEPGRWRSQLSL
jgi:hypothetical protein